MRDFLLENQNLIYLTWVLCRKETMPQIIPSSTGFQLLVQGNIMTSETSVGYLDDIDAPATDLYTTNGVLLCCLEIKASLHLESIVCVFNEVIYAKAAQVKYNNPEKFKPCALMLRIFHTLMYSVIIGKRFGDPSLADLLVQCEVLVDRSVKGALSGKIYNRAVPYVKLLYEALSIILIEIVYEDMKETVEGITLLENLKKEMDTSSFNLNGKSLSTVTPFKLFY